MTKKEEFIEIYNKYIHREGADKLLAWLEKSDFFTAPASTRFHLSEEGGLAIHSINVYKRLVQLYTMEFWELAEDDPMMESLAIVALLHDVCKVNFYAVSSRNVKDDKTGTWSKQPYYTVEEKLQFGYHGAKSLFLIERFMKLEVPEAISVANHMGAYDRPNGDYSIGGAFENCTLALLLSFSDQLASFVDEKE